MSAIYFECNAGICGSMVVGALLNAGVPFDYLQTELSKLNLSDYELISESVKKSSIAGTRFAVNFSEDQKHRHLYHITDIINASSLSDSVKQKTIAIFTNLAKAEAKIHAITIEKVHFHEVGAIDAIMDIVGSVICLDKLGITEFYASPVNTGSGWVNCAHGRMPVPAPATAELLKGIPTYAAEVDTELTTPTGAAIISTLCKNYGPRSEMITESIGLGAGDKDFSIPNLLRVYIGTVASVQKKSLLIDESIVQLESSIDDITPESIGHICSEILTKGALDAYTSPIQMKKSRPGFLLTVLCNTSEKETLLEYLFKQGITLGIRYNTVTRKTIPRKRVPFETQFGTLHAKIGYYGEEVIYVAPEFEDCKSAAALHNTPVIAVMDAVRAIARNTLR